MLVGIMGPHGSGKTTLAKYAAEEYEYRFIQTTVSGVYDSLGLDPRVRLTFEDRMVVQDEVLTRLEEQWSQSSNFIGVTLTDRTPIDVLAYTIADIDSYNVLTEDQTLWFNGYSSRCLKLNSSLFDKIILVPNAIPVSIDPTKHRANLSGPYRAKLEVIMRGLLSHAGYTCHEMVSMDLMERIRAVGSIIDIDQTWSYSR